MTKLMTHIHSKDIVVNMLNLLLELNFLLPMLPNQIKSYGLGQLASIFLLRQYAADPKCQYLMLKVTNLGPVV